MDLEKEKEAIKQMYDAGLILQEDYKKLSEEHRKRKEEFREEVLKAFEDWDNQAEKDMRADTITFPNELERYSTSQLKAELRRRKRK